MNRRRYREADRAAALAVLKANGGNVERTARETGIPRGTIRRWSAHPERAAPAQMRHEKEADYADLLDGSIRACLAALPGVAAGRRVGPHQLAIAVGTLIDKMQLLTGGATRRMEEVQRVEFVPPVWPEYDEEGRVIRRGSPALPERT